MYQILSIFLQLPTKDLTAGLLDGTVAEDILSILEELGFSQEDLAGLENDFKTIRETASSVEDCMTELRREYTRLFTHPKNPQIPYYETLFLYDPDKDGAKPSLFISPAAMDAERCYKKAGMARSAEINEPGDHIATEMEFMMHIYRLLAQGINEKDEEKQATAREGIREFTELHLRKWAYAFFEKCAELSENPAYQGIGKAGMLYMGKFI
jgi:TorA maturation chaperone TorD